MKYKIKLEGTIEPVDYPYQLYVGDFVIINGFASCVRRRVFCGDVCVMYVTAEPEADPPQPEA